ncbi:MAG: prolyl oligopeptidase family serine peptidase [Planctomycetota bacterium]
MLNAMALLCLLTAAPQSPALAGRWAGGFRQGDQFVSIEVQVEDIGESNELSALVTLPERGLRLPARVAQDGRRVTWVVDGDSEPRARFGGELNERTLRGRIEGAAIKGPVACDLVRVVPWSKEHRARYRGRYRTDAGATVDIVLVPRQSGDTLGVELPAAGLRSVLFPVSATEAVAGDGECPLPIAARVVFELGAAGRVDGVAVEAKGQRWVARRQPDADGEALPSPPHPVVAPGLGVERRVVSIDAGDVQLAATLYIPPGVERPCPAVVQLHGSSPTRRRMQWSYYTSICLRMGLAVLAFDKRGCGESTGAFRAFTVAGSAKLFDQLASDGAAAHTWLRQQPEIDPERVGLVGGSQAGWIMPLVAEKTPDVGFIVSGCGCTVSAGEEDQHAAWLREGLSLAAADRRLESYDGPRGFDPRPVLRRSKTPTLWLFGERDDVIPTRACLIELEKLRAEGHLLHDGHVFADADHNYRTSGDGVLLEPVITAWLRQRGILR